MHYFLPPLCFFPPSFVSVILLFFYLLVSFRQFSFYAVTSCRVRTQKKKKMGVECLQSYHTATSVCVTRETVSHKQIHRDQMEKRQKKEGGRGGGAQELAQNVSSTGPRE